MQRHAFTCLGRAIELWTHPEPDYLALAIDHARGFYEADVLAACRQVYLPGTMIVDAGANIGNHAVFFGAVLGAPVIAFEPFGPNYTLLCRNLAANGLAAPRAAAHCVALGAQDGTGTARPAREGNLGTVQVLPGSGETPVRRLDAMGITAPVGLLKVDVEGAEADVLRGAEALVTRWLPDIVVEAADAAAFAAVASLLVDWGYIPRGRYAWTPTYRFEAADQTTRLRRLCGALPAAMPDG